MNEKQGGFSMEREGDREGGREGLCSTERQAEDDNEKMLVKDKNVCVAFVALQKDYDRTDVERM